MSKRIDVALVDAGLAVSREKAKAYVMAGVVYADGQRIDKPGASVKDDAALEVRTNPIPYVSRGGLKLEKAVKVFPLELSGTVAMDIGASTGGFTDCMLQCGARHVYAIDVGYGQLDWKLRTDERVTVMERTNARFMEPAWFPEAPSFASIDVSFISLGLILPPLYGCLSSEGSVVALIKPQFEAERSEIGKNGVVRDARVHAAVCRKVIGMAKDIGFSVMGLSFSPVKGPKGNIEFLLYLRKTGDEETVSDELIQSVVTSAHKELSEQ